jgi:hypothetical protein
VSHSHPSKARGLLDLYGNRHDTLYGATATFAALLDAADEGFVDFNVAGKLLTFGIDHSHAKAL